MDDYFKLTLKINLEMNKEFVLDPFIFTNYYLNRIQIIKLNSLKSKTTHQLVFIHYFMGIKRNGKLFYLKLKREKHHG